MISENYFETYFYLSRDKFIISVFEKEVAKNVYSKELKCKDNLNNSDYLEIENFLEENTIQIETITKNFLNEICLIIEHEESLPITISLKINNDRNIIREKDINYLLKDAKQQINKNYFSKSILHMTIENYLIDGAKYTSLPNELSCDNLCLDLKFVCLSKNFIKNIETIFQKQQVFINKIICANYVKEFFSNEQLNICEMARKIDNGCNKNEIFLIPKTSQKKGIFERFFHFFG